MKLLTFLFLFITCTSAQISGKIIYQVSLSEKMKKGWKKSIEKTSKKTKNKKQLQFYKKINSSILSSLPTEAVLTFNKHASLYKTASMHVDSPKQMNLVSSLSEDNSVFYYNANSQKSFKYNCELLGDCFLIELPHLVWKITQETKKIGNYFCYKAVVTKIYKNKESYVIAWFTPEISVPFGPFKANGLPGLILELEDKGLLFKATKIIINPKKLIKIKKPKGKRISKKKFQTLFWKSMNVKF